MYILTINKIKAMNDTSYCSWPPTLNSILSVWDWYYYHSFMEAPVLYLNIDKGLIKQFLV